MERASFRACAEARLSEIRDDEMRWPPSFVPPAGLAFPLRGEVKQSESLPLEGKSAKRRQWRMQRADFEEVSRFSAMKMAGNRLTRRWARGGLARRAKTNEV